MFRRSVLIIAFIICIPILWAALVEESVPLEDAGIRYLIAVPVAALLLGLVRLAARTSETESDSDSDSSDSPDATGTSEHQHLGNSPTA